MRAEMRSPSHNSRSTTRSLSSVLVLLIAVILFGYGWASGVKNEVDVAASDTEVTPVDIEPAPQDKDYSRFTHSNQYHSRMPCLLCHRRDSNSPRISFPGRGGHTPCIGCHSLQFSDNSSPICTICHTNPGTGAMKGFPGLRSFGRSFDHTRHSRTNCAVCHKSTRAGVAFSIPSGANAHSTCFQCHSSSASFAMSSCNVCHKPGRLVRTSEGSAAFRANFSHGRHIRSGMSCTTCHSVRAGGTGRQVSSPVTSMHFPPAGRASCGACHNGTKTFGANDFTNCKRCHNGNSFRF